MKIKLGLLVISLLVVSASFNGGNVQSANKGEEMMCHMPNMAEKHDHQAMMAHNLTAMANGQDQEKDPDKSHDTPTHRYSPGDGCSSVDPNAPNKKRDGVKANTVGCKCVKKCTNGETQEDLSKDKNDVYVCSNACHKDRCSCPDPCKS